ncbi:MAG: topoisomerase DNA-binding C4 zinc finger domain-containing protein, partial [Firmicutes bacterium]|nr:topoisomerase DNA-binding C4 zinc finger domain-containing protein [Bacillota bacterium]
GELVVRRTKKGRKFFGCSRYPECEFITWDPPAKEKCPFCGGLMVEKKAGGKAVLRCINEACGRGAGKKSWGTRRKAGANKKEKEKSGAGEAREEAQA